MIAQAISESMVESVLLAAQWAPSTSRGIRYDGVIDGRRIGVVVDADDEALVVTTFWYREEA